MELSILNEINKIEEEEILSRELFEDTLLYESNRDRILDEAVEFLSEAYIGKTDTLIKIEDKINQIRGNLTRQSDFDRNKMVQEVNRLFEQQFGMDVFTLHIINNDIINAYTQVIALNFDVYKLEDFKDYLIADRKDGYRFKPNNNFCIVANVYWGLLSNPNLTDGEIVAIILHEIGHNFAEFLDNKLRVANYTMLDNYIGSCVIWAILYALTLRPIKAIKVLYNMNKSKYVLNNARKNKEAKKDQDKEERKSVGNKNYKKGKKEDRKDTIDTVLHKTNIFKMIKAKFHRKFIVDPNAKTLKQAARTSLDRRNEIIADKFAAVYGYGPELGSGLEKMNLYKSKADEIIEGIPVFGKKICKFWDDLYYDINDFDCHPHAIQRINECIKTLKDELQQKDMDPKLKSAIMEQIKIMEKQIEDIKNMVKQDPDNLRAAYAAYIADELPDATTKQIEDEINKEFNDALKGNN